MDEEKFHRIFHVIFFFQQSCTLVLRAQKMEENIIWSILIIHMTPSLLRSHCKRLPSLMLVAVEKPKEIVMCRASLSLGEVNDETWLDYSFSFPYTFLARHTITTSTRRSSSSSSSCPRGERKEEEWRKKPVKTTLQRPNYLRERVWKRCRPSKRATAKISRQMKRKSILKQKTIVRAREPLAKTKKRVKTKC